jgi:hypothetical protein
MVESRRPFIRVLVQLLLVSCVATSLAAAAPARRGASRQPFVGTAEPGLSRLAGNEVLVILNQQSSLSLAPNGRASARNLNLAATLSRHGLDQWHAVGAGREAARFVALTSSRPGFDPRAAARDLAATGAFRAVAPNLVLRPFVVPNDPFIDPFYEWHVISATAGVSLPAAWDVGKGDTSTVIAVMDNGIDISHPDLASQDQPRRDSGTRIDDDLTVHRRRARLTWVATTTTPAPRPCWIPAVSTSAFTALVLRRLRRHQQRRRHCRAAELPADELKLGDYGQLTPDLTEAWGYWIDQGARC